MSLTFQTHPKDIPNNISGIVKNAWGKDSAPIQVYNCINYGDVSSSGSDVGGIVSWSEWVNIKSCANFGRIKGGSSCVGGITGEHDENKNAKTINCVNYGSVSGYDNYIGAVIGRNHTDKGTVGPVYYNKSVNGCKASGTKSGSEDENKNLEAYSFKTPDSTLQSNLNGWSGFEGYGASEWTKDETGYGYIPQSVYELLYKES